MSIVDKLKKSYPGITREQIELVEEVIKGKRAQVGEVRTWSSGTYIKTADGWKPHIIQGGKARKEKKETISSELKQAASQAINDDKHSFEEIDEGAFGVKGTFIYEGKKYFVKKHDHGEQYLNKIELLYSDVVGNVFTDVQKYYTNKAKIDSLTFMSEFVDIDHEKYIGDKDIYDGITVGKKKDIIKLSLINYVLGNDDRHSGNVSIDKKGNLKLFDEGLAFCVYSNGMFKPSYIDRLKVGNIDFRKLLSYFDKNKLNKIIDHISKSDIDSKDKRIKFLKKRWNKVHKILNLKKMSFRDSIDQIYLYGEDDLEKARKLPIGTIRTHRGDVCI